MIGLPFTVYCLPNAMPYALCGVVISLTPMHHCCKVLSTKEEGQQRFSVLRMRAPAPEISNENFYDVFLNDM